MFQSKIATSYNPNNRDSGDNFPMNSCQFMDKQLMDLDDDHQKKHRLGDDCGLDSNNEDIVPSFDFHPIRPSSAAPSTTSSSEARVHCSASAFIPISTSPTKGFASLDSPDKGHNVSNTTIISEIDRTMKKHADTLLHVMDGVSARLTHLETRTHNLETLMDDLKLSVDNTHASTHGQLRQLKNILVEVQSGVQLLTDKQDIFEAQLQLSKHQVSKVDQHTKTHSLHVDPNAQSPAPLPLQQMPQFPLTSFPQPPSSSAAPSQPPSLHLLAQLPTQFSPQQEPYCPSHTHSQPPPNQPPYQAPPTPTLHQPPYQSPPQYPQQPSPSLGYNLEEQPPYLMQSYPLNPPRQQPPAGSAPSQQFYNPPQPQPSMYDGAAGRSNSGFPSGYLSEPYSYTGSPVASAKPPNISNRGTGYPLLSNSRHALPMTSAVSSSGGSSSPRSEIRVPIDDVIDRVTTMGFPMDQVRATVKKLTENGQAVDLNVVLDKLMNEGGTPPGGWFGGR